MRALSSTEGLRDLLPHAHPLSWFRPGRRICVADKMQRRYAYTLEARPGRDFAADFRPALTPAQMLRRGVFEGKYLNDCVLEFPREWFRAALDAGRLRPGTPDVGANEMKVKSRKSLRYWHEKGWIPIVDGDRDVRGWFQWYCRYWIGRRDPTVDDVQIRRWKAFKRHEAQIVASYARLPAAARRELQGSRAKKRKHRARQRQALLQWAYNPYV